jgi:aryl-alcohol dehydrogenase-like predicted oxidoreductase
MNTLNRREFLRVSGAASLAMGFPTMTPGADTGPMLTRMVPTTGETLGVIAYGGSNVYRNANAQNRELAVELVDILVSAGGAYMDAGGNTPLNLADWLDAGTLQKLRMAVGAPGGDQAQARGVIARLQEATGRSPLDFMQVRARGRADQMPSWPEMREWKEEGLVRHLGFTTTGANTFPDFENSIHALSPDYVQLNYSLFEPQAAERLLPLAQDQGVAVVINRPFMNGRYFGLVSGKDLPEWAADFDCQTWAQFSLKYIAAHPAVTCILTETGDPEHARDNVQGGIGRLPDEAERLRMESLIQTF